VAADLLNASKIGSELPSTDLDEGRHGRGVDSETVSDEVIVGSEFPQMQSDPIGPRKVIEARGLHHSRVNWRGPGDSLSIRY
jgi:hypothetical protein